MRRTIIPKLKCLPPISKSQSQVQELRVPNEIFEDDDQKNQFLSPKKELAERNTSVSEIVVNHHISEQKIRFNDLFFKILTHTHKRYGPVKGYGFSKVLAFDSSLSPMPFY